MGLLAFYYFNFTLRYPLCLQTLFVLVNSKKNFTALNKQYLTAFAHIVDIINVVKQVRLSVCIHHDRYAKVPTNMEYKIASFTLIYSNGASGLSAVRDESVLTASTKLGRPVCGKGLAIFTWKYLSPHWTFMR